MSYYPSVTVLNKLPSVNTSVGVLEKFIVAVLEVIVTLPDIENEIAPVKLNVPDPNVSILAVAPVDENAPAEV